jgi:predicted acetyltransferase
LRVERIEEGDRERIVEFYTSVARHTPGLLDRREFAWKRVHEPRGEKAQGYKVINASGAIEGYAFLLQKDAPQAHAQSPLFHLLINDVQFATPAAGMRLLVLIRQHRSVCDTAMLYGSPDHPLLALIPERIFAARHQFHWMLRILDVRRALEARGWNACVRGEVALDVRDDLMPENNGGLTLTVDGGAATVNKGGTGDAIIDIRGMAALYTGHLSPQDLMSWGRMQIANHVRDPQRVLETLSGLFAGPRPWLGDMF